MQYIALLAIQHFYHPRTISSSCNYHQWPEPYPREWLHACIHDTGKSQPEGHQLLCQEPEAVGNLYWCSQSKLCWSMSKVGCHVSGGCRNQYPAVTIHWSPILGWRRFITVVPLNAPFFCDRTTVSVFVLPAEVGIYTFCLKPDPLASHL